ncbi:MAG: helix-turn-helix domain-containing protein [Rhodococcus sp. (in: high G+C Gram-positive bacteria)]
MISELGAARKMMNTMERPTWLVGPQGSIDVINPAALTALGYRTDDDVLGRNSHHTFHHSYVDGTAYAESDCLLLRPHEPGCTRERGALEWMIRRDGSAFPVEWSTCALELDGMSMVVVAIDYASRQLIERIPAGRNSGREVASPGAERAALYRRAASYMAACASDPDVTPTSVARRHNVSIRLLQNVFAEHGESPARYLRRCRVERAAQSLREGISPRDACVLAGFGDESTFRRAFRDRFGTAPSDYLSRRELTG